MSQAQRQSNAQMDWNTPLPIRSTYQELERELADALAAAREAAARCERALALLAEHQNRRWMPPVLWDGFGQQSTLPAAPPDRLTAREVEILRLVAAGRSNRRIADALSISPRTVERHIANIYLKIDAHSKADATSYALRHGLA